MRTKGQSLPKMQIANAKQKKTSMRQYGSKRNVQKNVTRQIIPL